MSKDELPDYLRVVGAAAIGGRLRRLIELIDGDTGRIYSSLGVRFEQRWFGIINQIDLNGPMSVSELSVALGITHVSVSQSRKSLEKAGLVRSTVDPNDARRRTIQLTNSGSELLGKMRPIWDAFDAAAIQLDRDAGQVLASIERLEEALNEKSMFERIQAELHD